MSRLPWAGAGVPSGSVARGYHDPPPAGTSGVRSVAEEFTVGRWGPPGKDGWTPHLFSWLGKITPALVGRSHPPAELRADGPTVVHLTSVHRAEDPRIFLKEATSLAASGFDVTIVCAVAPSETVANGVRFQGVRRASTHQYVRDPSRGIGARLRRLLGTSVPVWRAAARRRADLYHFHDPELLPAGILLKVLSRSRVVYDAHEDLPKQIADKRYLPAPVRPAVAAAVGAFEQLTARIIDGVVTATPPIARRFPASKATIVQNFPLLGELSPPTPTPYAGRPAAVCYVGGLTEERGVRELLQAARLLKPRPDPALVIAGRLKPASFEADVAATPNATFVGWQDRAGVAALMARSRAGVVAFHPTPNYVEAYPIKLFEYMSAGLPVIASDFPIWREIVGEGQAGILVDPFDPRSIADAIEWVLAHEAEAELMGERGRSLVSKRYNWEAESAKLISLYRRLLPG